MLASMSATEWSDVDMAELLPTGTVTLLLADVEGSTQLWESQPEAMTAAIARMNQTVSKLVAEHGGVRPVEQGEGDSFVAAFARAGDAVACALELQRADLAPIKLRIGVHTGDVQLRDEGNYAGTTINKTARLRDLAHGGQTVISAATEEMVEDQLPDEAWLTDLGRHPLRDLPRPMRVAQLCHPDLRNDFPPLRTADAVAAHNLPAQLTSFVGRAAQITEIRGSLADNRLVTLTGAGGAGKTRLAIEVAGQMGGQFPDGVCYADLAPITHPDLVPLTVARALGLPDQPGRSITETLLRSIRDRQLLLVFDNCEHLLEASAELVNDVLAGCSRVTILATSREPLLVAGEVNWQVPSLSLADEAVELVHRPRPPGPAGLRGHRGTTPKRSPRSVAGSTACRWPSNWPPHGYARCRSTRSSTACTIVSGCSPAAPAPQCGASRRCAPRWTGRMPCSPNPNESCSAAWPHSWVASTSTPPKPWQAPPRWSASRYSTSSACSSTSRWSSPKTPPGEPDIGCWRPCVSTRWRNSASRAKPTMYAHGTAIISGQWRRSSTHRRPAATSSD